MDVVPTIRTSPQAARNPIHDGNSTIRLIVKLLRELVTRQRFESYADVKDALRRRLGSLRIRYDQREFDDAWPIVSSNLPLVPRPAVRHMVERPIEHVTVSRDAAADAMKQIRERLKVPLTVREIAKPARQVDPRQADRLKAAQMVAAEIVASVARCEALERQS